MSVNMNDGFGNKKTVLALGPSPRPHDGSGIVEVLVNIANDLRRIADHFDPPPLDIVDTPFIAQKLGVTPTRIAQMVREGTIPKSCIVAGSGNGRLWKFHRRQMEAWLANR